MLLSAYCLLPTDCKRRDHIEEIGFLSISLVEALTDSFSFRGHSPIDIRIYLGMALGLQRTLRTLSAFYSGGHPHHVDDLLPGGMERSGRGSYQS